MALIEFTSEYDRKDVVAALGLPEVAPPLQEHPETAVRILVDDLLALTAPAVSIGGLEAALPRGQAREEVAVLNFMRETCRVSGPADLVGDSGDRRDPAPDGPGLGFVDVSALRIGERAEAIRGSAGTV